MPLTTGISWQTSSPNACGSSGQAGVKAGFRGTTRHSRLGWGGVGEDRIAEAAAETHPERAVSIWQKLSEALIAQTQTRVYERASVDWRKLHRLLRRLGREREWQSSLTGLPQLNARKRRLLGQLDCLEGRRIIDR